MFTRSIKICIFVYASALILSFGLLSFLSFNHIWLDVISFHLNATLIIFSFNGMGGLTLLPCAPDTGSVTYFKRHVTFPNLY